MTQEEIHACGLGMLKFVDGICRQEKLTYWLSGGTLLGAVRHKGFIPWDDDVDLMMPRPDYERFVEVAPRYANARYDVVHPRYRKDYGMPWLRVQDRNTRVELTNMVKGGVTMLFTDVFPVDALPANPTLCKLFFKHVRLRDILLKCSRKSALWEDERLKLLKRALMVLTSPWSPNTFARWLDRLCARGNFDRARFAGVCTITHYGMRERMSAEVFRGTAMVTFCGEQYPAPIGWDAYLKGLYGDYMQLPPEDKRRSLHRLRVRSAVGGQGEQTQNP